jgi:hypothetical protein
MLSVAHDRPVDPLTLAVLRRWIPLFKNWALTILSLAQ